MNILLQNKKTLSYVTDISKWTTQHEQAHSFETGIEALFYCFNRRLKNMQILGEYLNPRFNFTLAVTDLRGGWFLGLCHSSSGQRVQLHFGPAESTFPLDSSP